MSALCQKRTSRLFADERGRQLRRPRLKMNFSSRDMACRGRFELSSLAGNRSRSDSDLVDNSLRDNSFCRHSTVRDTDHHSTDRDDHSKGRRHTTAPRRRQPSPQGTQLPVVSMQASSSCPPRNLKRECPRSCSFADECHQNKIRQIGVITKTALTTDVRFTPESGHQSEGAECPLSASSGHLVGKV